MMKKTFLALLLCAVTLATADGHRYPYISQLPEDSLLRTECEDAPYNWVIKSNVESACSKANKMLEVGLEYPEVEAVAAMWQYLNGKYSTDDLKEPIRVILAHKSDKDKWKEYDKCMALNKSLEADRKEKMREEIENKRRKEQAQREKQAAEERENPKY